MLSTTERAVLMHSWSKVNMQLRALSELRAHPGVDDLARHEADLVERLGEIERALADQWLSEATSGREPSAPAGV